MINKLENVNTINESKNTTYLSFYAEIYSCYYLLLDPDIIEDLVDLTHKNGEGIKVS